MLGLLAAWNTGSFIQVGGVGLAVEMLMLRRTRRRRRRLLTVTENGDDDADGAEHDPDKTMIKIACD